MVQAIIRFFKNLFQSPQFLKFENFCAQVFTAEKALVLSALRDFAISAVTTAEETGLDSAGKRTQAFNQIVVKAQTAGIVVTSSMIFLALEMALQALKNNSGNAGNVS